jgi:FMN phosphatase YigB (HAD superfamily)
VLGARPDDALFIDDKQENVEGARQAGLRAHHYRDLPTLRADLRLQGCPGI